MNLSLFADSSQATTFSISTSRTANALLVNIHPVVPPHVPTVRPVITAAVQLLHALNAAAVTTAAKVHRAAQGAQQVANLRLEPQPARLAMQERTAAVARVQYPVVRHALRESTRVVQA